MPNKQQKRERDRQDVVLFFELIQIAIGNRAHLSFPPNNIQWNNAFTIASQQSLIGITFVGLNKIPKSQMPNELLILKWFGMTELLVKRNKILNLQCEEVQKTLNECGLYNCILKGTLHYTILTICIHMWIFSKILMLKFILGHG